MPKQKSQIRTSDALELIDKLTGSSPEMLEHLEQERANLDIAQKIYVLRTKAKLSQAELAKKKLAPPNPSYRGSKMRITTGTRWRCSAASHTF